MFDFLLKMLFLFAFLLWLSYGFQKRAESKGSESYTRVVVKEVAPRGAYIATSVSDSSKVVIYGSNLIFPEEPLMIGDTITVEVSSGGKLRY